MKAKHEAIFEDYNNTFLQDTVAQWTADVERWNDDHSSKPDPYEEPTSGMRQIIYAQPCLTFV